MVKVFSIDWLSVNFVGEIENRSWFEFIPLPYGSRQFGMIHSVKWRGFDVGTVASCPTLPTLPKGFCQFKLENQWLYDTACVAILEDLMTIMKWHWHSISRLDLALDFHCFQNGMMPQDFIRRFLGGQYSLVGKSKFSAYGSADGKNTFDSLTIGSRNSPCRVYLYNKTKEMQEVKYKDWIAEAWRKAGLDPNREVWRLEVSIKHDGMNLADGETGEAIEFGWDLIKSPEDLGRIYSALVTRYFRFVPYSESKNRYRLQPLNLVDCEGLKVRRYKDVSKVSTNRVDKMFAVKLAKEMNKGGAIVSEWRYGAIMWANDWILAHGLEDYCHLRDSVPKL